MKGLIYLEDTPKISVILCLDKHNQEVITILARYKVMELPFSGLSFKHPTFEFSKLISGLVKIKYTKTIITHLSKM